MQASRDGTDAVCIFQTLAPPMGSLRGSLDESLTGKRRIMVDGFNRELAEDSLGLGDVLADEFGFAKVTQKTSRQQGSRLMRWGQAVAAAEPDSAPIKVVLHGVAIVQENANA